ncbi:uncharacterized protein LOC135399165 isoform X2 [Ornithodoros turicata]|uniref:uncharacterized protein LOC135399165 isoform X2 n=1 Tax=Ornithodoros turicata TaxID=34597 RepID=UPI003138FC94
MVLLASTPIRHGERQESGPVENGETGPSRVQVTLYECERPHAVLASPDTPDVDFELMSLPVTMTANGSPRHEVYVTQLSTDSGVDNPFRPDGELSREADTIVSLIKAGKPITPVKGEPDGGLFNAVENAVTSASPPPANGEAKISPTKAPSPVAAEKKTEANGSTPASLKKGPGVVEVQQGIVVPPSDSSTVEQVVIKKKPKCKCCVIQ